MNSLYQKYNIVIEAIRQVVLTIPTNSWNTKKNKRQKTIAEGFVLSII